MLTVSLRALHHRQKEQIGIYYANDKDVNNIVRRLKGVRWSQTNKCWYLPLSLESHKAIKTMLASVAEIDETLLKQYLHKKKQVLKTVVSSNPQPQITNHKLPALSPAWKLGQENLAALQRFIEYLKLKAYSPSTIKTYRNEFLQLLQLSKQKPVNDLTADDLRRYFMYCFEKLKLTENTLHSRINAIVTQENVAYISVNTTVSCKQ